jgi:hypothetical protein
MAFFENQQRIRQLLVVFFVCCIALFCADIWVPRDHVHFPWERSFGFYAVFGFVACVVLVLIAKYVLRPLVMRREDFYDS